MTVYGQLFLVDLVEILGSPAQIRTVVNSAGHIALLFSVQTDAAPPVFVHRSVDEALSGFWVTIIPRWPWHNPSLGTIPIYAVRATAVLGLAVKEHVIVPESVPLAPDVMVNQSPPCCTDAVQETFV